MKRKYLIHTCIILCFGLFSLNTMAEDSIVVSKNEPTVIQHGNNSLQMIIPPGQISGRGFKVFVPGERITMKMKPKLLLKRVKEKNDQILYPDYIANDQAYTLEIQGESITKTGTILLFKTNKLNIPFYFTSIKALPILTYEDPSKLNEETIINPSCCFIGSGLGTALWTIVSLVLILYIIARFLHLKGKGQFIGIISDKDGQVSMSLLQMLLWTIVVGSMVLAFGLLSLEVPNIPPTLIMLMLFAAVTTATGQFQTSQKMRKEKESKDEKKKLDKEEAENEPSSTNEQNVVNGQESQREVTLQEKEKDEQKKPDIQETVWKKLNTVFYTSRDSEYPSIAKVQVLIWTVITLALFIYLSINQGELWNIPTELVVLMGISQVSFLTRQQQALQDVKDEIKDTEVKIAELNRNKPQ